MNLEKVIFGAFVILSFTLNFGFFVGAIHLATTIVALIQLIAASLVRTWAVQVAQLPTEGEVIATVVSLAGGALAANFISVALTIGETLRRTR